MAEILLLPGQPSGLAQATRLHADLVAAHVRGADLGSRVQHIQAGGEQLLELSCRLDDALADLDRKPRDLGLQD